jgi:hypothetical protein
MTQNRSTKKDSGQHHARVCSICKSPHRREIEAEFFDWIPQAQIARDFKLSSRLVIHRHARAVGLFRKRDANVRAALSAFIERGARVKVTAQSFVAAAVALSKLDEKGRSIERVESVNSFGEAFGKMTRGELRKYAEDGSLPHWFRNGSPDTQVQAMEDSND